MGPHRTTYQNRYCFYFYLLFTYPSLIITRIFQWPT